MWDLAGLKRIVRQRQKKREQGRQKTKWRRELQKRQGRSPKMFFFYKTAGNGGFLGCGKWLQPSNCYAALGPRNLILLWCPASSRRFSSFWSRIMWTSRSLLRLVVLVVDCRVHGFGDGGRCCFRKVGLGWGGEGRGVALKKTLKKWEIIIWSCDIAMPLVKEYVGTSRHVFCSIIFF